MIIAVGTNVFSSFFYFEGRSLSKNTKLIHLDSAQREIGKSEPTDIGIAADPKIGLEELANFMETDMTGSSREDAKGRIAKISKESKRIRELSDQRLKDRFESSPMSAERMMHEIASALPDNTIIADDSVTSRAAVHSAISFNKPGSIHGERGGALGWGMGGALGIKLAHPGRTVIAIVGDGSAMMTVQALWTASNLDIPVIYVICNNQSYRILKLNMDVYKKQILKQESPESKYLTMDFPNPMPLADLAKALGIYGRKIGDPKELQQAIKEAVALGKPAVLDVSIDGRL